MPRKPTPIRDRIMAAIVVDERGCWIWQRSRQTNGYPNMRVGSTTDGTRRNEGAHRVSYREHVGPIPDGHEIDHLCRTPLCVNPEHLEAVTRRENLMRSTGPAARNAAKDACTKCGGPYTVTSSGHRRCRPCYNEWNSARHARHERTDEDRARQREASRRYRARLKSTRPEGTT